MSIHDEITKMFDGDDAVPTKLPEEHKGTAANIQMVPKELQALQLEILQHPQLLSALKHTKSFSESVGTIAAYVDVVLDGMYSEADIAKLCDVLRERLIKKRGPLVQY